MLQWTKPFPYDCRVEIGEVTILALAQHRNLILNVADPEALTVYEIGSNIAKAMGWTGKLVQIDLDPRPSSSLGWTPWSVPGPFTLSTEAAREIGYTAATDYARSVSDTCRWLRNSDDRDWRVRFPILADYPLPLFDYETEDAFFRG